MERNLEKTGNQRNMMFLADLHSLSTKFTDPDLFQVNNPVDAEDALQQIIPSYHLTNELLITLLACGVDPSQTLLFKQSHVPAHCQLQFLLSALTPVSSLNNMIQFREKKRQHKDGKTVALFSYPLLMAADILLYSPEMVPVGEDQTQHLELTRQVTQRFNQATGTHLFRKPALVKSPFAPRIMNLSDASSKMSKSNASQKGYIGLLDSLDEVYIRIMKAKTDSISGISLQEKRPEVSNLIRIYSGLKMISPEQVCK